MTPDIGMAVDWTEKLPSAVREHVSAISRLPDFPRHLARFSDVHHLAHPQDRAVGDALAEQARRLAPNDPVVRHCTEWSFRRRVQSWHFQILNDRARNEVYRAALERHVRAGTIVFEVGAGSGILAMLAAQAGAAHVYTCECEPLLVEVARENIARNGLADRVTVIARHSTEVQVGRDLPRRADLFVAELVDDGLLGENVLAISADVRARLLEPGAIMLPDRIELRGALVGGEEWTNGFRVRPVYGLEVSAIDRWGPCGVPVPHGSAAVLGDEITALQFDLTAATEWRPETTTVDATVRSDGTADGFLTWIRLRFGDGLDYCKRPPAESCWTPQLHTFPNAMSVAPGRPLKLAVQHDGTSVRIRPVDGAPVAIGDRP